MAVPRFLPKGGIYLESDKGVWGLENGLRRDRSGGTPTEKQNPGEAPGLSEGESQGAMHEKSGFSHTHTS